MEAIPYLMNHSGNVVTIPFFSPAKLGNFLRCDRRRPADILGELKSVTHSSTDSLGVNFP